MSHPHQSLQMAQAIRGVLFRALTDDPAVVVLGETVGRMGGAAGTTEGLQAEFEDRVQDLPIADRGTVGVAVGMALGGQKPVVELAGTSRLAAVLGPLADAGAIAARGEFPVPLVLRVPCGQAAAGLDAPVAGLLTELPGVHVVCPSDPGMAAGLLRWALGRPGPTVVLEPRDRLTARGPVGEAAVEPAARVLRTGTDLTLAAWGSGVPVARQAAEALSGEGIEADVVDLVRLSPLDGASLGERVRATGRLVVVDGGDPGWAAQVRQAGLDEAFLYLEAPMGESPALGDRVAAAARAAVAY